MLPTAIAASAARSVFVYGTLCSPKVLEALIDRVPPEMMAAELKGYRRHPVVEQVFPGMIPAKTDGMALVNGVLLQDLSNKEMDVLDWFEGKEYERQPVEVYVPSLSATKPTETYIWANPIEELDRETGDWSLETFEKTFLDWYLQRTVRPYRMEYDQMVRQKQEDS
mmetsp:Transcript_49270/g.73480  ORF Transcript_49270/g.73480 Transcript_49270/m.73480 type:complete len:167 (+) Transcript_49270:74-574(+)